MCAWKAFDAITDYHKMNQTPSKVAILNYLTTWNQDNYIDDFVGLEKTICEKSFCKLLIIFKIAMNWIPNSPDLSILNRLYVRT